MGPSYVPLAKVQHSLLEANKRGSIIIFQYHRALDLSLNFTANSRVHQAAIRIDAVPL